MRKVRAGVAAFTLLCFALPWLLVSCNGKPVYRASGLRFMLGFDYSNSGPEHRAADPLVIAAFVFVFVVLLIGLLSRANRQRGEAILCAVLFGVASVCLVYFSYIAAIENLLFVTVTWGYGYYLALPGTIAGAIVCVVAAFRSSPRSMM